MKKILLLSIISLVFANYEYQIVKNPDIPSAKPKQPKQLEQPVVYGEPLTKVQEKWYSEHDAVILNFAIDSNIIVIDSLIGDESIFFKFKSKDVFMSMFIRTDVKNFDVQNISYTFYDLNDVIMFDSDEYKNSPKLNKVTKNCNRQFLKFLNEFYVKPFKNNKL